MASCFDARKAAQVAAFFCAKAGGEIHTLKLVKLIYLADREAMAEAGSPITHDRFVSMKNGPVVSETYSHITGDSESDRWDDLLRDGADHMVALARPLTDVDDDELSRFDKRIMESVWAKFGGMDRFELVKWTHKNCPEWENPGTSSKEIPYERVFKELNAQKRDELAQRLDQEQRLRAALKYK